MKYPAYPDYKNDKQACTGVLPEHWHSYRLKFLVELRNEKVDAELSCLPYMGLEHIESWTCRKLHDEEASAEGIASRYIPGDVLFGKLRPYLAKVYLADHEGLASTEALVMTVGQRLLPRFLKYALVSSRFVDLVSGASYGSKMPRASWEHIGSVAVAVPTIEEQEQVSDFLDWRTAQIDALIAKKQALLERLSEKRSTLITRAVTRGIQPHVDECETGSPWIPKIPTHWTFMKFGHCTSIAEGQVNPEEEPFCDLPLVAPNHIEGHTGRLLEVTSAQEQGAISGKYLVRAGDIVYSKIRPHLNKCALVEFEALCSADAYPIRTDAQLLPQFLKYWMLARPFLDFATESSMRVAMPKINRETLNTGPLAVPPIKEQSAIVEFIEAETKAIDLLASKTEMALSKLFEYRSALITAAVTGQIDVRGVPVPAPV